MYCCKRYKYFEPFYTYAIMPVNFPNERPTVFMRDEYIDIWFYGLLAERHIDGLVYQYDKGLIMNIRGLNTNLVNKIQFTRDEEIIEVQPSVVDPTEDENYEDKDPEKLEPDEMKYLQAGIPDQMLTTPGTLVAYLVYDNDGKFRTVKTIYITVQPRAKTVEEEEETTTCCDKIDALAAQIAELAAKINGSTAYSITDEANVYSITTDGSYGQAVTTKETEANAGDTVTFAASTRTYLVTSQSGTEMEINQEDTFHIRSGSTAELYNVWSFVMPSEPVTIHAT